MSSSYLSVQGGSVLRVGEVHGEEFGGGRVEDGGVRVRGEVVYLQVF